MKIGNNMKYRYILLALTAVALISCTSREIDSPDFGGEPITIRAYQEGSIQTKTTLLDGGTQVYWEPADEIKLFFRGSGSRFLSQNTTNAQVADFSGMLSVVVGINEGASGSNTLWGLYPYRADATSDGTSVTTTLPAEQTGRAGSFAKGTFITLAQSTNFDLAFYNVTGGIRFSLTQEGVKEVIFQGQNDEDIAGKVKIAFSNGVPAVQEIIDGQKTITLTAPNGGTFETGKWYYIVALPGTLANGFKMTFNTATQYATLTSSGSKTIRRGIFGSLADADEELVYTDKGGSAPNPDDVIQFKDPIAKYACVEKFDTDKDGEVSYAEAAAATTLSGLFTDWNTVTEFDEIQYFTSVTSTSSVFTGLAQLKHITIPDNITTLGTFQNCSALDTVKLPAALSSLPTYCFDGCSSLKSVTLPTEITSIPSYAFRNCAVLTSLDVPPTITSVGQYAFSGCTILTGIDMPSGFTTVGNYAFQNCRAIVSVSFPASLTSIGQYAFSGCTALTTAAISGGVSLGEAAFSGCTSLATVVLPEDMTSLPAYCFQNCTKLTTITWPVALTAIGNNAFEGCSFADNDYALQLPSSVVTIGNNAFGHLHHLVLPSTTSISIASSSFEEEYTILYVPGSMVEMYKLRMSWSKYADRIWPMSDYPCEGIVAGSVGEAVDLGLSVKWASWNVGASAPEEYGEYFAWGATEPSLWEYDWGACPFRTSGDYESWKHNVKFSKYNTSSDYGPIDNYIELEPGDDAASVNWGGSWRMPTDTEWTELRTECTWTWTTQNGVDGRLVTGPNGNSIFLPAAGRQCNDLEDDGWCGFYWSSSLDTVYPYCAHIVYFSLDYFDEVYRGDDYRCLGLSVRPVTE